MVHTPARNSAATAVLRRVLAHRAVHRLLVLAGLVTTGWLIGGAAQAFADTAVPVSATVAQGHTGLTPPDGVVRGASTALAGRSSVPTALAGRAPVPAALKGRTAVPAALTGRTAALGDRAPLPTAFARTPRGGAVLPLPGHPTLRFPAPHASGLPDVGDGRITPGGPVAGGGAPGASRPQPGTGAGSPGQAVSAPERPARTAPQAARSARTITRPSGGAVATVTGHARRSVSRTFHRGPHAPVAPIAPAPGPVPAQAGSLAPVAGPVLFGGLGGVLLRRAWTPRPPKAVLVRASGETLPTVLGATDEPSTAPD